MVREKAKATSKRRLRIAKAIESRRVLMAVLACVGVLAIAGTSTAVVISSSNKSSHLGSNSSTATAAWTTPGNELNAPSVVIAGGAFSGSGNLNDISCPTTTNCVAVGGDNNLAGLAAVSSDGGSTWTESDVATGVPQLNAVDCPIATECVAVGVAQSSTSSDGGVTWQAHHIPTPNTTLLGVSCATTSTCVAVGVSPGNAGPYFGQLLLSTDGGVSWSVPSLPTNVGALGSVDCPSPTFCVAVGDQILVSSDGGQTWNARFVNGGTGVLRSVSCSSSNDCVALGPNPAGVNDATSGAFEITSSDGGVTWNPVSTPIGSSTLSTLQCFGEGDCIAGGPALSASSPAIVFQSSNGGASWSSQTLTSGLTAVGSFSCPSVSVCVFTGKEAAESIVGGLNNGVQGATSVISSIVALQNGGAQ